MEDNLNGIAEKHGILLALRFGSSATGKTHARSDVDIAVLLDRSQISFREHLGLLHDVQQLFSGREVDLAILNHADPLFLKKITDHCEILYGPLERLQRLRIYAFKRFQDHRKYFEMERRYAATYLAKTASAK
jgi:predicted nucleotidyltransferase